MDPRAELEVLEKRRISCIGTRLFIKDQYSYTFLPREIIITLALEHCTKNIQTALLEMRCHCLHRMFRIAVFVSVNIQTVDVDKRYKDELYKTVNI